MSTLSNALRTGLLGDKGVSELLTGGTLHAFSGPVPATADAALDIGGAHTLLVSINGGGGLNFKTPANGVLAKADAQTWSGTFLANGVPSFYRLCASGDTGATAGGATTYRLQGTAGGPTDGAELDVGANPVVSGNTVTLNVANIRQPSA